MQFSGAFAKLRKAAIGFIMPVCLYVRLFGTNGFPLEGPS